MYLPLNSLPALSLALSLLCKGVHSLPQPGQPQATEKPQPRPPVDEEKMKEWCSPQFDLETTDSTTAVMDMANPAAKLDAFLREVNDGSKDWLENFPASVFGTSRNPDSRDCSTTALTCAPRHDDHENWTCEQYFEYNHLHQDNKWAKSAFWIYKIVEGVYDKMTLFHKELASDTLANSLRVDNIIEDFGADKTRTTGSSDVYAGFVTGLAVFGAVAGMAHAAGPVIGGAASAMSAILDAFEPEPVEHTVPIGSIGTEIADRFTTASEIMGRALAAAVGREREEGDYERLKKVKFSDSNIGYGPARFLDNPLWLLSNDNAVFTKMFRKAEYWMQLRMAQSVIMAMGLEIAAGNKDNNGPRSKDGCEGGHAGRRWMEVDDTYYCFSLVKPQDGSRMREYADQQVFDAMTKYGIESFSQFYWNAIDCAQHGGSGGGTRPDATEMVEDYLPRCFYSIPVKKTTLYHFNYARYQYNDFFAQ